MSDYLIAIPVIISIVWCIVLHHRINKLVCNTEVVFKHNKLIAGTVEALIYEVRDLKRKEDKS